jgi:hypothetical protein
MANESKWMAVDEENNITLEQATQTTKDSCEKYQKKRIQWLRHFPSLRGPIERSWNTELPVCWNFCFILVRFLANRSYSSTRVLVPFGQ